MSFWKKLFGIKDAPAPQPQNESPPVDVEAEYRKAMQVLSKFKRAAYVPIVKKNANTFSDKSKIGGFPYLRNASDWPQCPHCNNHLQLFLQLNMQDLPERKDTGLIQLFYCTNTERDCESELEEFFPFSEGVVCRRIDSEGESASTQPVMQEIFDEKLIIDWETKDDYPHSEEYAQLGIDLPFNDGVYELMESGKGLPLQGDKLFGWPYWVQSVEYPVDRNTGKQMELLFQFDSEVNLPYMFGDAGVGHLTQSPDDKNELGFGWACH